MNLDSRLMKIFSGSIRAWSDRLGWYVLYSALACFYLCVVAYLKWNLSLLVFGVFILVVLVPVCMIFYLYWLVSELINLPNTITQLSGSVASVIDLEKTDKGWGRKKEVQQESGGVLSDWRFLISRGVRKIFKVLGIAFDVSDISGLMALAISLSNPFVVLSLVLSLIASLGVNIYVIFHIVYSIFF